MAESDGTPKPEPKSPQGSSWGAPQASLPGDQPLPPPKQEPPLPPIEGTPTITPDNPLYAAYGISGLTRYGGISRVYEEFLRELQGPAGMKNFREMRDNCAVAGGIFYAAEHLLRRTTMRVEPANPSIEAKAVAEFVRSAIFEDMDLTWPDQLSEILTMFTFGHALLEMRLKRRLGPEPPSGMAAIGTRFSPPPQDDADGRGGVGYPSSTWAPSKFQDGLIGFRSWELRSQETLYMWEFDEDSHPIVMQQQAPPDYRLRRIPVAKSLLFRTRATKGNPEGVSLLRNGWLDYYFAKNITIFEGVGIERELAGYPVIQMAKPDMQNGAMPPDIWNQKDPDAVILLAQLKKMVRSVRRDEQEGMVLPWWAEFKLVSTGGRRSLDTNAIVQRHDLRIAMSMVSDFVMLGHESVGSKALAQTKVSIFTAAQSSFLDTICGIINRGAIPMLLRVNGIPHELTPLLTHADVENMDISALGDFIGRVSGKHANLFMGENARRAILQAIHFPTGDIPGPDTRGGLDQA